MLPMKPNRPEGEYDDGEPWVFDHVVAALVASICRSSGDRSGVSSRCGAGAGAGAAGAPQPDPPTGVAAAEPAK